MPAPKVFLAYAPRAGLGCVVAYLACDRDVYGWMGGPDDGAWRSSYFVLEDYYSQRRTRCVLVGEGDLYLGGIDEARCHELAWLRDFMEHEWIFHRDDPQAAADREACARAHLAVGEVGIRFRRLNRLSKLQATWTYYSPAFEEGVLDCLVDGTALDYRLA
jgi:hypothetical protein